MPGPDRPCLADGPSDPLCRITGRSTSKIGESPVRYALAFTGKAAHVAGAGHPGARGRSHSPMNPERVCIRRRFACEALRAAASKRRCTDIRHRGCPSVHDLHDCGHWISRFRTQTRTPLEQVITKATHSLTRLKDALRGTARASCKDASATFPPRFAGAWFAP